MDLQLYGSKNATKKEKQRLKSTFKTILNHKNLDHLTQIAANDSNVVNNYYEDDNTFNYYEQLSPIINKPNETPVQCNVLLKESNHLSNECLLKRINKCKPKSVLNKHCVTIGKHLPTAKHVLKISNRKKRLLQKVMYKNSVLEVFNHHQPSEAKMSSVDIDEESESTDNIQDNIMNVLINTTSSDNSLHYMKDYFLYNVRDGTVLIMKPMIKLYFSGKVRAKLVTGNVEILGYKLSSKHVEIYSLKCSSLLCFDTHSTIYHAENLTNSIAKLSTLGMGTDDLDNIKQLLTPKHSIVLLSELNNEMCCFIQNHLLKFNPFTWKHKSINNTDEVIISKSLQCVFYNQLSSGIFCDNPEWDITAQQLITSHHPVKRSISILCGGKGSGKSTFLRYLVNKYVHHSPVLVVDLDPGQPEFTIAGLLSATILHEPIIGPNYTHLKTPLRSVYLGLVNVADNEERYLKCIEYLLKSCSNYENIPWIVNYMGYVDSSGFQLLSSVVNIIKPTNLVEIRNHSRSNNYDSPLQPDNILKTKDSSSYYKYIMLQPYKDSRTDTNNHSGSKHLQPRDCRFINILSYFTNFFSYIPYSISLDSIKIGFNNIIVDRKRIFDTLNGQTVALCHAAEDTEDVFIVGNTMLTYYGHGIVRGIDRLQNKLYINTPLSSESIRLVNSVLYSDIWSNSTILSAVNTSPLTRIPYAIPADSPQQHKLVKAPKRRFNLLRLLELRRKQ